MLKGHYVNTINEKGRLSIPSKFRDFLNEWGANVLIVTKSIDPCLWVFTPDDWEKIEKLAAGLSMVKREDIVFKRHVVGSAEECPLDAQGRILIPASLREYAGLRKKCLVVGLVDRIEIWDQDTYNKDMEGALKDSEKLREGLASIGV
ncbi:MAG: division/cell wall cluster transcriptional repressor MraZ [Desulfobacterota bacterium]|nr:division/cell wall cluster transcriptional repressor MraZ [Thermodesulfobacteriota bacterium]